MHQLSEEEKTSVPSKIVYWWLGRIISTAVKGELSTGVVTNLSFCDKCHSVSTVLFKQFANERAKKYTWLSKMGKAVRRKDDYQSRGSLQRTLTAPSGEIVSVVEWTISPGHYHELHQQSIRNGGPAVWLEPSTLNDGEPIIELRRQIIDFSINTARDARCNPLFTVENPSDLRFLEQGSEVTPAAPSLLHCLFKLVGKDLAVGGLCKLIHDACYLSSPMVLRAFVDFVSDDHPTPGGAAWIVAVFFLLNLGQSLALHKHFHIVLRSGLHCRSALMGQIFHKALTLSPKAALHPELHAGRIVNMMSGDVERVNEFCGFVNYVWSSPMQVVVSLAMMYQMVGWVAFACIALMLVSSPIQAWMYRRLTALRRDFLKATDNRVKATNEMFGAIRIVKYMGWETRFEAIITGLRQVEISWLKRIQLWRVGASFVVAASPIIVMAGVFVLYAGTGHRLVPRVVFPMIALLNILRFPFMMIPSIFTMMINFLVSLRRISQFLDADDGKSSAEQICDTVRSTDAIMDNATIVANQCIVIGDDKSPSATKNPMSGAGALARRLKNASDFINKAISYTAPNMLAPSDMQAKKFRITEKILLRDVSIRIPSRKLTVVFGKTGSGKSTLLNSLLGHYKLLSGSIKCHTSVAYAPQQPWIMNASVKDNILFFLPYDSQRYEQVIRVCQLTQDLRDLPAGDMTEIGEKGVNLSGGQKARVSLARAVYSSKDMYLLDDPLAAVDAHVSERLLADCFLGALAGTTRVLVTHYPHVLRHADFIVSLDAGCVVFSGDYGSYQEWNRQTATNLDQNGMERVATSNLSDLGTPVLQSSAATRHKDVSSSESDTEGLTVQPPPTTVNSPSMVQKQAVLMTTEERAVGNISISTYLKYFMHCGGWSRVVSTVVLFFVTETIAVSSNVWLSIWSQGLYGLSQKTYLTVYVATVGCTIFNYASRAWMIYDSFRLGSLSLHAALLTSVSRATTAFFDTTPLGRILNRFAKDIDQIDNDLPMDFLGMMGVVFAMISSWSVMIASQPFVLVAVVPVGIVYSRVMKYFNAANREVKRVDTINKSPVFALLSEALEGAKQVSVYHQERSFVKDAMRRIDAAFSSSYLQAVANRWLGVRLEFMGNILITSMVISGVTCKLTAFGHLDVGLVSLGVTLALSITQLMNWTVRTVASVEADMNSVERIFYYAEQIELEDFSAPPTTTHHHDVNHSLGISFQSVSLRYREGLPLVLKNVSFEIKPKSRVGIVGRTGSGKSTTMLALLRLVNICDGRIFIGSRDAATYSLKDLRNLFAMIPQDPVLFNGTIKSNLDPFDEHDDATILGAIEIVGMTQRISEEDATELDTQQGRGVQCAITEGGKNFSVGQRQLLCLARAILKKNCEFILMDEATANIDQESDKHIQKAMRRAFGHQTVIIIAHRLHTILDADLIVVMDRGEAKEVGTPTELMNMAGGTFSSMIDAYGTRTARKLRAMAQKAVIKKAADIQQHSSS